MIFCDRQQALDALKIIGRLRCAYAGDWPDNICDCKYGGPVLMPHPVYGANLPHEVLGEQTGCPELRTLYRVIEKLTDGQWENAVFDARYGSKDGD